MKNFLKLSLLLLAMSARLSAFALTYTNTNLLLVFRQSGFNDVEFNLGSVSNFTGLSAGTMVTVTNWSLNAVLTNYNNSLSGASFLLAACTEASPIAGRRTWLTDADPNTAPTDVFSSILADQLSTISKAGSDAAAFSGNTTSATYITDPSQPGSYTADVSNNGQLDAATLGGRTTFVIEQTIPGASRFFMLKGGSGPFSPAVQVGTFTMNSSGVLTFVAGNVVPLVPAMITRITRSGSTTTVAFTTTTNSFNYRLRYADVLSGTTSITNWTMLPTSLAGNGLTNSLQDTTAVPNRFYGVEIYR